ncbi:MAG TPA: amidohydrolase family protein [Jiangellaceae bacterium]
MTNTRGLSRRDLLRSGAAAGGAIAFGGLTAGTAAAWDNTGGGRGGGKGRRRGRGRRHDEKLALVNGKIHTMDQGNRIAREVLIEDGEFTDVGWRVDRGSDVKVIDLRGRTVVPGLIESHTHFVSLANRPGWHVAQLELAESIDEVLQMLADRRAASDIPEGEFITAMGGWHPRQWAEGRLPTLDELDEAVADRPVFLFQQFAGPAAVNSLGKEFFENVTSPLAGPVQVGDDGSIATDFANPNARAALYHLRVRQTFDDKKRSTFDAMAFTAQVGVTTLLDQTLVAVDSDPLPTHFLANLNHFRMYDAWLDVHRNGEDFVRLQINFLHNQGRIPELGGLENQLPELRERLKNQFQFFGDDMLRTGAIGEWPAPLSADQEVWFEAQRLVAEAQWRNENSPRNTDALTRVVQAYEALDAEYGIKHLRWGVQHAEGATPELLDRLKALNCGVSMSGFRWLGGSGPSAGAPFRTIVDSGVPASLHEDGVHIAPHNPWFAIHYATTGLNLAGEQINEGEQITRQEALHAYTQAAAWFLNREDDLGSIEKGKLADLLVLDRDYFQVSDDELRRIKPVLTVVDGQIVHDTGEVT